MKEGSFLATNWIHGPSPKNMSKSHKKISSLSLPSFHRRLRPVGELKLEKYLHPGWNAQSLSSKNFFRALSYLETLQQDLIQILVTENFPPKHIGLIWQEYKKQDHGSHELDIKNFAILLKNANNENSSLYNFVYYYSARLIMLYFLQLRLLKKLHLELNTQEIARDLFSPPLALSKIFAKGTKRELKAKSLEHNQYSWYRPAELRLPQIYMLYNLSIELSFPETLKLLIRLQKEQNNSKYSHAMSHLGMGLLLNCIQVNLPKWQSSQQSTTHVQYDELHIHSTLYTGDYLEELGVSYWLAQENNKTFSWDELICPHFTVPSKDHLEVFDYYFHELQQLHLLSEIHKHYKAPLLEFISKIFQQWKNNIYNSHQRNLLENDEENISRQYDQVILSALDLGKGNSFHQLIQKINQTLSFIKDDGYILIISNQNIFLPSQSEKVSSLFKSLSPVCTIDLSRLEGKGETGNFFYVFKKRHGAELSYSSTQAHYTLRFSGILSSFHNFCSIPEEINNFFQKFLTTPPSIYQSITNNGSIQFDYFHSPIVNGIQIYSSDQDGQQITHPQFFKNLLKNTMPLNYFFEVSYIDPKDKITSPPTFSMDQLLPFKDPSFDSKNSFDQDYILLFDSTDHFSPKTTLAHIKDLRSTIDNFGICDFYYYKLRPLSNRVNISVFKYYLESKVGQQILGITTTNNKNQIRSKINTFLVPTFILNITNSNMSHLSVEALLNINIDETNFSSILEHSIKTKENINAQIDRTKFEIGNWKEFNFNTEDIVDALKHMEIYPIYPSNHEFHVSFSNHKKNLNSAVINHHEVSLDSFWGQLHLKSNNNLVATIKAVSPQIIFLDYLLKNAPEMTAAEILTKISIPCSSDCTKLIQLKSKTLDILNETQSKISEVIDRCILFGINL